MVNPHRFPIGAAMLAALSFLFIGAFASLESQQSGSSARPRAKVRGPIEKTPKIDQVRGLMDEVPPGLMFKTVGGGKSGKVRISNPTVGKAAGQNRRPQPLPGLDIGPRQVIMPGMKPRVAWLPKEELRRKFEWIRNQRLNAGGRSAGSGGGGFVVQDNPALVKNLITPPLMNPDPDQTSDELHPSFDLTANYIYFASTATGTRTGQLKDGTNWTYLIGNRPEQFHIWRMDPNGRGLTEITKGYNDRFPALSPSGKILAFARQSSTGAPYQIWVRDLSTGDETQLTFGSTSSVRPTWSPGSDYMAYSKDPGGGTSKIFRMRADGQQVVQLTSDGDLQPGNDTDPAWSPDGRYIVYVRDGQIWRMRADNGSEQTQWTSFSAGGNTSQDVNPSWSPGKPGDEEQLIFATTRKDSQNTGHGDSVVDSFDIFRMTGSEPESGTNDPFTLTNEIGNDEYPTTRPYRVSGSGGGVVEYHTAFQSDRAGTTGPHDIWISIPATPGRDETPPEVVDLVGIVTPRLSTPGDTVTIRLRVKDEQSGVDHVWVQFKDPDSENFDSKGLRHKIYKTSVAGWTNEGGISYPVKYEVECESIDPLDYKYHDPFVLSYWYPPLPFEPDFPGIERTLPGEHMLELFDDGPLSQGGREPEGETANDGLYTNTWQTPGPGIEEASDFYCDFVLQDKEQNLIVYDNLWGFSTQYFYPTHQNLYVNDYGQGQRFVQFRSALFPLAYPPTESYFTDNIGGLRDLVPFNGFPDTPENRGNKNINTDFDNTFRFQNPNSPDPYDWPGNFGFDGRRIVGVFGAMGPTGFFSSDNCDIWRVLARGPIDYTLLANYLPFATTEPDPNDPTKRREKMVMEKSIVWSAPYTGDLWVGPGTILDQAIQQSLVTYLENGGRMILTGQDVAWALTSNGNISNPLLTTYFGADLANGLVYNADTRDSSLDVQFGAYDESRHVHTATDSSTSFNHPLADHALPGFWPATGRTDPRPFYVLSGIVVDMTFGAADYILQAPPTVEDGCWNQVYIDNLSLQPSAGFVEYTQAEAGTLTGASVIWVESRGKHRTGFFAHGIEGMATSWADGGTVWIYVGRRGQMIHNATCWFKQARFAGLVTYFDRSTNKFHPLEGALIKARAVQFPFFNQVLGTDLTMDNGKYQIVGCETLVYEITGYKPGYTIQHGVYTATHGGLKVDGIDLIFDKVSPGSISGTVTDQSLNGLLGAEVKATEKVFRELVYTATTNAEGKYRIENVAAGDYIVEISQYPPGYGNAVPSTQEVTVSPSADTPNVDFQLLAADGTLQGVVRDSDTNNPVADALVEVLFNNVVQESVKTDNAGAYLLDVPGGLYDVRVSAAGYNTKTVTNVQIVSSQVSTLDVYIDPLPPGSVSGLVKYQHNGLPVEAGVAQVAVYLNNVLVAGPVDTTDVITGPGNYKYNYKIDPVPSGSGYEIRGTAANYTIDPISNVVITPGVETKNKNLLLKPLYIFNSGVQLVSTPFDYVGGDAALLMGITNGDLSMATWVSNEYLYYPNPLRNFPNESELVRTFRLGRGYFTDLVQNTPLLLQGTSADTGTMYPLALEPGWNLIGDPFPFSLNLFDCQVKVGNNSPISYHDALAQGVLYNGLWTYLGSGLGYDLASVIQPYQGYWLGAKVSCTLLVSNISRAHGPMENKGGQRSFTADGDWSVKLLAKGGGVGDSAAAFGVSREADDTLDNSHDVFRPPFAGDPTRKLEIVFEGGHSGDSLAHDIRSNDGAEKRWKFSVNTELKDTDISLTWPEMGKLPKSFSATLTDLETKQSVFMRTSGGYTFRSGSTGGARRFEIVVKPGLGGSLLVSEIAVQGIGRGAGRGTASITFQITKDAQVDVIIRSLNGKRIRLVQSGGMKAAGVNQVVWDGRDDQGRNVPRGRYLIEVKARAESGEQSRNIAQVEVER